MLGAVGSNLTIFKLELTTLNIVHVFIYIVVFMGSIPRMESNSLLDASLSSYNNFFIVMAKTFINNMSQ